MVFSPAIAQMAFALYLALFVVFLVAPSVSGVNGVSMLWLIIISITALGWVSLMVVPVAMEKPFEGWMALVTWVVSIVLAVLFFVGILYDIHRQRKVIMDAQKEAAATDAAVTLAAIRASTEATTAVTLAAIRASTEATTAAMAAVVAVSQKADMRTIAMHRVSRNLGCESVNR